MPTEFSTVELIDILLRFGINMVTMLVLIFGMYYKRYQDRELVIAAALFNVFVFGVLTILSSVQFSLAAGFGLFAILALFTLRSEQISKTEITYFFGSISVAVICSVQGSTYALIAIIALFILIGAYIIDHPKVLGSVSTIKVNIEITDPKLLSSPDEMRGELSKLLGVEVLSFQATSIDFIAGKSRLSVNYREHG